MDRSKYLLKNTFYFALGSLGSKIINFFLVPLYTNVLTPGDYGIVDLVFTICSIAVPIITFNTCESVMRFPLDEGADTNKITSVGLSAIVVSVVLGTSLIFFSSLYETLREYKFFIYFYAISYGASDILLCNLRGREQLLAFSIGNILKTFAIGVLNIIFLLVLKKGINGYLLAYVISNIVASVYAFFAGNVSRNIRNFIFDKELAKRMFKYSFFLIPTSLTWWIINSSDRLMLTAIVGVSSSGIYAAAARIPALVSTISTIFNQAFSYSAIKEDASDDRIQFNNRIFGYLVAMVASFGTILLCFLKSFMSVYVGKDFFSAWIPASPLVYGTSILVLGTFFSVSYTVNKDSKGFMKSGLAGAALNIILNLLLIGKFKELGAAIATCASYIVVTVYRGFDIRKYLKIDVFSTHNLVGLISLTLAFAVSFLDQRICSIFGTVLIAANVMYYKNDFVQIAKKIWKRK